MDGGYRWYVGDLRTGKIARTIDLVGGSWSTAFDSSGALSGTFPLLSGEWAEARSHTAPAKMFLAASFVDDSGTETFLEGGPIWTTAFNDSTGVLEIGAASLSSYFDHRKVMPVLAAGQNPAEATVTYNAYQLGMIAKNLVALAQSYTAGHLPIVLPSDAELGGLGGLDVTRTYPGYELGTVGERLKQLTEVQGGPEIQYVPRRRSDDPRFLEWVMRIGVAPTMMLTQSGPPWVFDRTVAKSPVAEISVSSDGSGMATRYWAAGQGEAEGTPIVFADSAELTDLGWPMLEAQETSIDTVSETGTLDGYTAAGLAKSSRPIETWSLKVNVFGRPNLGQYRPGDWAEVRVKGHIYLPDGDYDMRILALSGDASDFVTVALSPRLGDI